MPLWERLRSGLIETIYPKTCAGCGLRGTWLCADCERSVPRLDRGICFRCGAPARPACSFCLQLDRSILQARAAYPYHGWVAKAVRGYKYSDEWSRSEDLARRLAPSLAIMGDLDVIVPVPLHPSREARRGYNQSCLLAEHLGNAIGVPMQPWLRRTRDTVSQVTLSGEERSANMTGAFALDKAWAPPAGSRVLLVDDVRTTCATLNACAKELQRTGPRSILVATVALDVPKRELQDWLDEQISR